MYMWELLGGRVSSFLKACYMKTNAVQIFHFRYVIVGLNWLQAVIKRWWSELSSKSEIISDGYV